MGRERESGRISETESKRASGVGVEERGKE